MTDKDHSHTHKENQEQRVGVVTACSATGTEGGKQHRLLQRVPA